MNERISAAEAGVVSALESAAIRAEELAARLAQA
jgi:hypothetical protein